jgi:hypothetical protein
MNCGLSPDHGYEMGDGLHEVDRNLAVNLLQYQDRLQQRISDTDKDIMKVQKRLREATERSVAASRWFRQQQQQMRRRPTKIISSKLVDPRWRTNVRTPPMTRPVIMELRDAHNTIYHCKGTIRRKTKAISQAEARSKWLYNCVHNEWSDTATDYDESDSGTDCGQCGQLGLH